MEEKTEILNSELWILNGASRSAFSGLQKDKVKAEVKDKVAREAHIKNHTSKIINRAEQDSLPDRAARRTRPAGLGNH